MSSERSLTPTAYLVLGVIAQEGPSTAYQIKQYVESSLGVFWSFPHSQLYAAPQQLASDGLLKVKQEEGGRRRRTYSLTAAGRRTLKNWLVEPSDAIIEVRALGLLKLFFGDQIEADKRKELAALQASTHREHERHLESLDAMLASLDPHSSKRAMVQLGVRIMHTIADFWQEQHDASAPKPRSRPRPSGKPKRR